MSSKVKKQLRDKLIDDIQELSPELQALLKASLNKGAITEEDIIAEIDDMDAKAKMLEKFYELAEKLSLRIVTIEEVLIKEAKELQKAEVAARQARAAKIRSETTRRS